MIDLRRISTNWFKNLFCPSIRLSRLRALQIEERPNERKGCEPNKATAKNRRVFFHLFSSQVNCIDEMRIIRRRTAAPQVCILSNHFIKVFDNVSKK
jgi:hypothetical protein